MNNLGRDTIMYVGGSGSSQWYTQIGENMYRIDEQGIYLQVFNMRTLQYQPYWNTNFTIPISVGRSGCLASYATEVTDTLFILGGLSDSNTELSTLQILDINTLTWISNTPSMSTPRAYFACIVHPETSTLYAIGGELGPGSDPTVMNSVEKLFIGDGALNQTTITTQWVASDNLVYPTSRMNTVIHEDGILAIGGYTRNDTVFVGPINVVQRIDINTGMTSIHSILSYAVMGAASIKAKNRIYTFGGAINNVGGLTNTWQYFELLSS